MNNSEVLRQEGLTQEQLPEAPRSVEQTQQETRHEVAEVLQLNNLTRRLKLSEARADAMEKERNNLLKERNNLLQEIKEMEKQLEEAQTIDSMTGLLNKKAMHEKIAEQMISSKRYNLPLSVGVLDIDHFKKINDTYGHIFGDEVLKSVAKVIQETMRDADHPCRFGGEEFCVVLPATKIDGAKTAMEHIRAKVEALEFTTEKDGEVKTVHVTISGGVAQFSEENNSEEIIAKADDALYNSKNNGRNKISTSGAEKVKTKIVTIEEAYQNGIGTYLLKDGVKLEIKKVLHDGKEQYEMIYINEKDEPYMHEYRNVPLHN